MIEVRVSEDGMLAEVAVVPEMDEDLTEELVKNHLRLEGVQAGIDDDMIFKMLRDHLYGQMLPVAKGKPPVAGKDAYYTYTFEPDEDDRLPRIREDGSVDYSMVIKNVEQGALLAEYHPETNGNYGYNVFAKAIAPERGKALPPLLCKNVRKDENQYYAEKNGYVTMSENSIAIEGILEIDGDADFNSGDIKFNGDIHVRGSIVGGIRVWAEGSVIIDGVIEDARVTAGQDIIVSRGIHGQGTHKDGVLQKEDITVVDAKGNLTTKFIDHAFAKTGGDIIMDYAISSVIEAGGMVTARGTKGTIVGGTVSALKGVDTDKLGNQAELATEIKVGDNPKLGEAILAAKAQVKNLEEKLAGYPGDAKPDYLQKMLEVTRRQLWEAEQKKRENQIAPIIVHDIICSNVKLLLGTAWAPNMAGKNRLELRNINGRILCKPIGTYSRSELTVGIIDAQSEVVAVEKFRILVIDDDARLLRTVNGILAEDYQVAVAKNGAAARNYLQKRMVDLILLDYMMPDENGVEVLQSFRAWDKTENIPVVFLTGLSDKKKIMECLSLRPAGYIVKPVDREKLLTKLKAILGEK